MRSICILIGYKKCIGNKGEKARFGETGAKRESPEVAPGRMTQ